jgi:proline iminopeptidase
MKKLYPAIKPYNKHTISVDEPHVLYVEESGNPEGLPVIFLHGGPGAGCSPSQRQFFDPDMYRIILFDQRGCGLSKPHAELDGNNTQALLSDIEVIRDYLDIKNWVVFGGSWGSTLALLYAQAYPERALGLILRGIFLCRPQDIDWFYQHGANRIFPDFWQEFIEPLSESEQQQVVKSYYKRLSGEDELARMAAAKAWSKWEARCASLRLSSNLVSQMANPHTALSMARIECHYFINDSFIQPNQILDNMESIQHIPAMIVHGRYDMVCPVDQAYALKQAWPDADLKVVSESGHSAFEPATIDALVTATQAMGVSLT